MPACTTKATAALRLQVVPGIVLARYVPVDHPCHAYQAYQACQAYPAYPAYHLRPAERQTA